MLTKTKPGPRLPPQNLFSKSSYTVVYNDSMLNFLDKQTTLQAGDIAPDFTLTNLQGESVQLYALLEKSWVVLFFYPKDNTPGCTAQVCSFRDHYSEFRQMGVEVIGISRDSEQSHQSFSQKQQLPYTLLSDPNSQTAKAFGVQKTLGLLPGRATFVIAPDRRIQLAYASQLNPESHQEKALAILKAKLNPTAQS